MSFGIRQTFRTQHISRKIARTNKQENDEDVDVTNTILNFVKEKNENNVFDKNQNFVNNVLKRSQPQTPVLTSISSVLSVNDLVNSSVKNSNNKNSNLVSARLNLLKNHNRGVTRSEDHF